MALNNFFHINMPYGMWKNEKGEWFCFNREYAPLGFTKNELGSRYWDDRKKDFNTPSHTKYRDLSDKVIKKIVSDGYPVVSADPTREAFNNGTCIWYDASGKISRFYFSSSLVKTMYFSTRL